MKRVEGACLTTKKLVDSAYVTTLGRQTLPSALNDRIQTGSNTFRCRLKHLYTDTYRSHLSTKPHYSETCGTNSSAPQLVEQELG